MKRTLLTACLLSLTATLLLARMTAAVFGWTATTHDFGRIVQGKPVTATFAFTNRGELPLLIANAKGSCGCTGVTFPKQAILPGQSGVVQATFNAAAAGAFNKTVTVESNAEGGAATLLIRGEVVTAGAVAP
jgi:Protein of unknown function (DUF1573)